MTVTDREHTPLNTYVTEILETLDARTAELRLDLGFHLTVARRVGIERIRVYDDGSLNPADGTATEIAPSELAGLLPDQSLHLLATTRKNSAGKTNGADWSADLHLVPSRSMAEGGGNDETPQHESAPPALWRYRAKVGRVIDGDTIDAVIDVGFGIEVTERLRFKGIQTPEIFGVPTNDPSYQRGKEAKRYVERRLADNDGRFLVTTSKRGKWRRWLADLHLPDTDRTLNDELIDHGLATDYDSWLEQRRRRNVVRTAFDIGRDVREQLAARATADGRTPAQLLRHIVERFLNMESGTQ